MEGWEWMCVSVCLCASALWEWVTRHFIKQPARDRNAWGSLCGRSLRAHTHTHTHTHTLPFLLRSNLLVSIPLSLLSRSPTGPEIINLFLHSSYVSTIPPPSCYFFPLSSLEPGMVFVSLTKEMHTMRSVFCGKDKETRRFFCFFFLLLFLWSNVREGETNGKGDYSTNYLRMCVPPPSSYACHESRWMCSWAARLSLEPED